MWIVCRSSVFLSLFVPYLLLILFAVGVIVETIHQVLFLLVYNPFLLLIVLIFLFPLLRWFSFFLISVLMMLCMLCLACCFHHIDIFDIIDIFFWLISLFWLICLWCGALCNPPCWWFLGILFYLGSGVWCCVFCLCLLVFSVLSSGFQYGIVLLEFALALLQF